MDALFIHISRSPFIPRFQNAAKTIHPMGSYPNSGKWVHRPMNAFPERPF
jgi:hypothetical protein